MTKSAEFEAPYYGQNFLVRIDYDGAMTILEPVVDLEYHIAFAAMGGDKSNELQLMETWEHTPIALFCQCLYNKYILSKQRHLIALDWAEHVIPLYHARFQSKQKNVTDVIDFIRKHPEKESSDNKGKIRIHLLKLKDAIYPDEKGNMWDSWFAISALNHILYHDLLSCAQAAATAMSHHADPMQLTPEFNRAYETERLWQIRRIIDVVNALEKAKKRKNAPKNWPPLEATP